MSGSSGGDASLITQDAAGTARDRVGQGLTTDGSRLLREAQLEFISRCRRGRRTYRQAGRMGAADLRNLDPTPRPQFRKVSRGLSAT